MFDRVVLCSEGQELHAALRAKNLTLASNDSVAVYLLASESLNSDLKMAAVTVDSLTDGATWKDGVTQLTSVFSMQTELHVAAYGSQGTAQVGGYYVVVVVSGKALICARSDERLIADEKLEMTFDVEETNGVLKANADFDGNITQGLLKKLVGDGKISIKKRNDEVEVGSFGVNTNENATITLDLGTAADADVLEGEVYDHFDESGQEIQSGSDSLVTLMQADDIARMRVEELAGTIGEGVLNIFVGDTAEVTFSANDHETKQLTLGEAAKKGVDTSIDAGTTSSDLPTSKAVDDFVGKGSLSITVHPNGAALSQTFSANESGSVNINLGLGDAADKSVDNAVSDNSENLPTSKAVATYVSAQMQAQVGAADIHIFAGSDNTDALLGSFNVNQGTSANLILGEAAGKGVDAQIGEGSNNLPTSSAVASYVGTANLKLKKRATDNKTITFSANASDDVDADLGLGTAADKNALDDENLYDLDAHGGDLTSLSQVKDLIEQATSINALPPEDANPADGEYVTPQVGQMMWLAIDFSGQVGIVDFTTGLTTTTPVWSGTVAPNTNAYLAEIVDNAGDFRATSKRIANGCTFRTLNAMDSTGMTSPSYGFALCVCVSVETSNA